MWREQEPLTTKGGVGGGSSSNSSNNKKRPLDEVKQQRRELERQLVDLRHELKKRILNEADIVLSTLSGAGGQIFTKVMKVPFYTEHKRKLHTHKPKQQTPRAALERIRYMFRHGYYRRGGTKHRACLSYPSTIRLHATCANWRSTPAAGNCKVECSSTARPRRVAFRAIGEIRPRSRHAYKAVSHARGDQIFSFHALLRQPARRR